MGRAASSHEERPAASTADTFRQPAKETRKTTLDFDIEIFRALKLYAAHEDTTIRELVNKYCRAGLTEDGAVIE